MCQHHKLIATFEGVNIATIQEAINQEAAASGYDDIRACTFMETADKRTLVEGPAQSIMFLIGRVAGFGEDGLISVSPC